MKPIVIYNGLVIGAGVVAIFVLYLVLGLFEEQVGTPVILRPGEEPFAYDTDVSPFAPCCGLVGYLLFANGLFALVVSRFEPFKRVWWLVVGLIVVLPFAIPFWVVLSAIFLTNELVPIIISPEGG